MNVDIGAMWAPPRRCPGCGELGLHAVVDGEQTNFECPSCKQIWRIELGYATPVEGQR